MEQDPTSKTPRPWLRPVAAGGLIVVLALAATVLLGLLQGTARPAALQSAPPPPTAAPLFAHVEGAVAEPGLYRLPAGSRVVDAVAAAGGLTEQADRDALNLARPVKDGEQLHVPVLGESPPPPAGSQPHTGGGGSGAALVNLNTATVADLETLPRIGPAIAGQIVAWRDANGSFRSVEDLLAVPGIGEKLLASVRDLVTV